ncbi:MAG: DUF3006 domain-containing protein [Chloroflexi bacterium]|nr:DUF3006 domain-containing protein [Chloroflexota bacterium]
MDRIEGNLAVLLVSEAEEEMIVPLAKLPPGIQAGDWLRVERRGGQLLSATLDPEETEARRRRIRGKLDRLLGRTEEPRP